MNPRHPLLPALVFLLVFVGEAWSSCGYCEMPDPSLTPKQRGELGNDPRACVKDPSCAGANSATDAAAAAGKVAKGIVPLGKQAEQRKPSNSTTGDGGQFNQDGNGLHGDPANLPPVTNTVVNPEDSTRPSQTAAHNMVMPKTVGEQTVKTGAGNIVSTQKGLTDPDLIQAVRNAAQEKMGDKRYANYKGVIQATADSVIAAIGKDGVKDYPADQGEAFGRMVDVEMGKQLALEDLNKRNRLKPMPPAQYEAEKAAIMKHVDMNGIPDGVVMTTFHTEFDKRWQENLASHPNPDAAPSALPVKDHIGDMIRTNPKSPSNWALSGMDKLVAGDKAGAMQDLNRSIDLGGTADAFGLRGGLRAEANDFVGAYRDAVKGLEMAPGDKALMGLLKTVEGRVPPELRAQLGFGGGSSAGAGGSQASARGASAGGSPGFGGYGGGFAAGGFGTGPAKLVEGMTSASVLNSNAKLEEARRAWALGDVLSAIAAAERALELNPSNAAAHAFLSGVYASRGDYRKSLASASAGLAISPRDGQLLNSKAFAQNRLKQYRDALESSNSAIESDSRNPYSFANRAHAYGGLGDRDAMLADLNRAAGLDERFKKTAAQMAGQLQLPSNADVLFLFPGEDPAENVAPAAPPRKSFGAVLFAAGIGGVLLALGLLSTVLAPLKDSVVSAFTKATRRGPSLKPLEAAASYAAEPASSVETGLIKGQYEISRQIGAGGMGMVYEGTDRSLGRRVAIKKMRDELRVNARERDRFIIEAKTVASLHHPNIVDIYAIAEEGDDVYLVFEYVDGKTIHDLVQVDGRLQMADAVQVTRAIGDALAYAHAHGVIHRDMKPSNVMLTADGRIKVMDFGIARMAKDALTRYSMTNTVVGTPPYMAPEQEQGVVRKESDVYSLAICAYEMLTGKLPFIGMGAGMLMNKINMSYIPPSRNIAGLPASIDEVFLKAFQADPENRYRTPQEFCAALEAAAGGARNSSKTV